MVKKLVTRWKSFFLKGQGATEYLVLLAVVLIIALVAIALLGFFPGMASDAKATQSKAYWQSASPIGVVEGIGYTYNDHWADYGNAIIITLQNNGGETIELLGIGYPNTDQTMEECNIENPIWPCKIQFFSVSYGYIVEYGDNFGGYVASPHGYGWGGGATDPYTSRTFIAPGEKITVGISALAYGSDGYRSKSVCHDFDTGQESKSMEIDNLAFYYAMNIDGIRLIKRQVGSKPLVIPCSSDTPPF